MFATVDAAVNKLPSGILDEMLHDLFESIKEKIFSYHLLPDIFVMSARTLNTTAGFPVTITRRSSPWKVNHANVLVVYEHVIPGTHFIIHPIDEVLIPPLDVFEKLFMSGCC